MEVSTDVVEPRQRSPDEPYWVDVEGHQAAELHGFERAEPLAGVEEADDPVEELENMRGSAMIMSIPHQ